MKNPMAQVHSKNLGKKMADFSDVSISRLLRSPVV